MQVKRYKVKAICRECEEEWTTKAKKRATAPAKCKFCGSTNTKTKSAWTVKRAASKVSINEEDMEVESDEE